MVALANLYTILDVSIQQLAVGLAILPLLVALAWYVSHPIHRRQLSDCHAPTRHSRTLTRRWVSSARATSSGLF
jgi:hypothetical protein